MKDKVAMLEELTELLDEYYNGSFSQMVCDYIHSMDMTKGAIEELLEAMRLCIS